MRCQFQSLGFCASLYREARCVYWQYIRNGNIGDGDVRPHQRYAVDTESLTMEVLKNVSRPIQNLKLDIVAL
jgi:hypothetical protein